MITRHTILGCSAHTTLGDTPIRLVDSKSVSGALVLIGKNDITSLKKASVIIFAAK
jgi:hypothetical protein